MALVFHERVGLQGRRISPFSWRIRYAFAHKGLDPEVVPTRFAEVARIRALRTMAGWYTIAGPSRAIWRTGFPIVHHCSAAPLAVAPRAWSTSGRTRC
jgi:hypothetical protein